MIKIEELNIYPIKGCRAVSVDKVDVTSMGLVGDRELAVLSNGQSINQDKYPIFAGLSAIYMDSNTMKLSFPNTEDYYLDLTLQEGNDNYDCHGKQRPIVKIDSEASRWLSSVLNLDVDLMSIKEPHPWHLPLAEFALVDQEPQSKFVDAAPILLTSTSSLENLNSRLTVQVPMNRFRANIVISGLDEYQEDIVETYAFPDLKLQRVTVCERCIVTTTDQQSGERSKEPLLTLSKYRKRQNGYAGGIQFGIYLSTLQAGTLSVGDTLQV